MNLQKGMSLIEVMIAMIIMAIGILGVSGMQAISLAQNRSALYRGEATQLANDLMDRVRVNTGVPYSALIDADPTAATDCNVSTCSPTNMAAFDISQWKCSINSADAAGVAYTPCGTYGITGSLPLGSGSVALVAGVYEVTVEWADGRVNELCGDRAGTVASPDCTSITIRAQLD